MPRIVIFSVPGITCSNCTNAIETQLKSKQIRFDDIQFNIIKEELTLTFNDDDPTYDPDEIAGFITEIGFDAFINQDPEKIAAIKKKYIRRHRFKAALGILTGLSVMALCLWGMGLPLIAMMIAGAFSTLITLYLGKESFRKVISAIQIRKIQANMDLLFVVSTVIAIGVSLAAFAFPWLPMMFDASLLIFGFRHAGEAIRQKEKMKVEKELSPNHLAPLFVEIADTEEKKAIGSIKPDELIVVRKGGVIPLDGICLTKKTKVITDIKTGISFPISIGENYPLLAGMVAVEEIRMRVTKNEKDSFLSQIAKCLKAAEKNKTRIEIFTQDILKYIVPTVFILAIISGITIGFLFTPLAAIQCAVTILTSFCPCTLGIIPPLAIDTAKSRAYKKGSAVANGASFEAANTVKKVAFDLCGTLTTGVCTVLKNTVPDALLPFLNVIESEKQDHLIGNALYKYTKKRLKTSTELKCQITGTVPLTAIIDGHIYTIGNKKQMEEKFSLYKYAKALKDNDAEHIIYFAKDEKVVGYILLGDPLRKDAKAVIDELRTMGKEIYICTGSSMETALKYAKKLNIPEDHIRADCLPDSEDPDPTLNTKKNFISELGDAAMVGDALNDAPAIITSQFGFAMKSQAGNEITQTKADAIIQTDSLWPIISTFSIARQMKQNINQNIFASMSYNAMAVIIFGGVLVALGIAVNPAIGAALMILQMGLILLNVWRFKHQSTPPAPCFPEENVQKKWDTSYKIMRPTLKPEFSRRYEPSYEMGVQKDLFKKPPAIEMTATSFPPPIKAFEGKLRRGTHS